MADPDVPNLVHSGYEITMVKTDSFDDLAQFAKETLRAKLDKSDGLVTTILDKDGSLLTTLTAARVMDKGQFAGQAKGAAFAIMPPELAGQLIKTFPRPGTLVLDPFMGSGTTALMSRKLGHDFVGFEIDQEL
jgi:DNA modification methylase